MTDFTPARLAELRAVAEALYFSPSGLAIEEAAAYHKAVTPREVLALIAALEAKTAEVEELQAWERRAIEQVRDTTTGQPSPPDTDYGELIDRLKRERDEARAEVSNIEGRAVEFSRQAERAEAQVEALAQTAARNWSLAQKSDARAHRAEAALERVRAARAGYPECDKYDDDSPVKCGWKRTVQSIDAALEAGADDE